MVTGRSDSPRKKGTQDDRSTASGLGRFILILVPIVISLFALFFSAQTYYIAHRPYVGEVAADVKIITADKKAPVGMKWTMTMENTGVSPAIVVLEKNVHQLTTGDRVVSLPLIGPPLGSIVLMPKQKTTISGHFMDAGGYGKVADVLSGKTLLTVSIELRYSAIGWFWWANNFVYQVRNRLRHDHTPPGFIMEYAYAN